MPPVDLALGRCPPADREALKGSVGEPGGSGRENDRERFRKPREDKQRLVERGIWNLISSRPDVAVVPTAWCEGEKPRALASRPGREDRRVGRPTPPAPTHRATTAFGPGPPDAHECRGDGANVALAAVSLNAWQTPTTDQKISHHQVEGNGGK